MKRFTLLALLGLMGCSHQTPIDQFKSDPSEVVDGQIVIDLRDDLSQTEIDQFASDYKLSLNPTVLFDSTKEEIAWVDPETEASVLDRMHHDGRVEIAEPLYEIHMTMEPNDPRFAEQWGMAKVNAQRAWDFATGRGVIVGVIDTGVAVYDRDGFHTISDLKETAWVPGWNFIGNNDLAADDQSHGTHCAGTIAQSTNNKVGVVGLAFNVRLMPVKVLSASGSGSTAGVADGIRWATDNGAQIISMSLGGGGFSEIMQKSIDHAKAKGVTVIVAAGNSGRDVEYPAKNKGSFAVSATDRNDEIAKFSSRGPEIAIGAPGVEILQQTICDNGKNNCEDYKAFSGTSMATPAVAAAAALVVSLGVSDPLAVEQALRDGAHKVDESAAGKLKFGSGILDAAATVRNVTMRHALWRLFAVFVATFWVGFLVKRVNKKAEGPWNLRFFLPALFAGPGLFFFAPWVLSRADLVVDLLARPFADMDLVLFGQSVHKWLPFGTAALPFLLTTLCYGMKKVRVSVAGFACGTAAYLIAAVYMHDSVGPVGWPGMVVWYAVNILVCLWISRENLSGPDETSVPTAPNVT